MSFGSESTTDEVLEGVDLSGRWVLITGASAGLGQETARAVARHGGNVVLDDVNFEQTPYDPWQAYGRSKTANMLFAVELDRRGRDAGQRACAVHPGTIITELGRYMTEETFAALPAARAGQQTIWKSIPAGAATSVWAGFVADAAAIGGRYCQDCRVAATTDDPAGRGGVFAYALDPDTAKALWSRSEELVGEAFPT